MKHKISGYKIACVAFATALFLPVSGCANNPNDSVKGFYVSSAGFIEQHDGLMIEVELQSNNTFTAKGKIYTKPELGTKTLTGKYTFKDDEVSFTAITHINNAETSEQEAKTLPETIFGKNPWVFNGSSLKNDMWTFKKK